MRLYTNHEWNVLVLADEPLYPDLPTGYVL
jgi:hypothetical protein